MEALFYPAQDLDLLAIAQALVLEYQARGYQAQHFGDLNNVTVQLKQESTLRTITGFNKALAISLQRVQNGVLVRVGAQDRVDQIAVGAVGLAIHPLLITAAIGALQQYNALPTRTRAFSTCDLFVIQTRQKRDNCDIDQLCFSSRDVLLFTDESFSRLSKEKRL